MKTINKKLTQLLFFFILISFSSYSQTITLESLLKEMTNREVLSEFPSPYYTCKQFSSYDRASVDPTKKSWFANWDRSMFIREEMNNGRKEFVLMDSEGPGSIVRVWMTFAGENSGKGIMRIYIDNNPEPVIEDDPLSIVSGGILAEEPISGSVSHLTDYNMRGHNLYIPIPYSKNCKITYESENISNFGAKKGGEAVYYQINYRTYEKGTNVESFNIEHLNKLENLLRETENKLINKENTHTELAYKKILEGSIEPGKNISLNITHPHSAIKQLSFKIEAPHLEQALRSTIIHISFDGNKTVSCPLGDFFGTGYLIKQNKTWYTNIEEDGTITCYWIMPFKEDCNITLENKGYQAVQIVKSEIITDSYEWTKNTMYFSSQWKQFSFLRTGEMKNNEGDGSPFDINYVNLKGKGVYIGDCLSLFNTVYAWWGEGDEKIYIDGERFPSHFGTGTEDYYGYAWCRPEAFTDHPFISQPIGNGNFDPGYTQNIRFRSLDAIPFKKTLRFDMEMWHWTKAIIHFSPITFWYIKPENVNMNPTSNLQDASLPIAEKREDLISPVITNSIIEGENMMLLANKGGDFRYSNNVSRGWSNNMQIIWSNLNSGDSLTLSFISTEEKVTNALIKYSKGIKYGAFNFSLNNKNNIEINANEKDHSVGEISLKDLQIYKGKNILTLTFIGSEEKNQVGLDCIELIPAR